MSRRAACRAVLLATVFLLVPAVPAGGGAFAAPPSAEPSAQASTAATLRLPADWPVAEPGSLALDLACAAARARCDRVEIRRLDAELAGAHAGEDWAIVNLAANQRRLYGLAAVRRQLAARDSLPEALRGLDAAALDLAQAVIEYTADRHATAADLFRKVSAARPDWAMCHAYLFRCAAPLLKPLAWAQEHLDACSGNPLAIAYALDVLAWELHREPDSPLVAQLRARCAEFPDDPVRQRVGLGFEIKEEMRRAGPDAAAVIVAWTRLCERYGALAWYHDANAASGLIDVLPTEQALAVLEQLGRDPSGAGFREYHAWMLSSLERYLAAAERLDVAEREQRPSWGLRMRGAGELDDAAAQRKYLRAAAAERLDATTAYLARIHADALGDHEFWPALWSEISREFPQAAVHCRLDWMDDEQTVARAALLDSVAAFRIGSDSFADDRRSAEMTAGGGPSLVDIMAVPDRTRRADLLADAARRAEATGNTEEAGTILLARIEAEAGKAAQLRVLAREASTRQDRRASELALAAWEAALPGDPAAAVARVDHTAIFGSRPEATGELTRMAWADWDEPAHVMDLARTAAWLEQGDLALAACRRALELAPRSSSARALLADQLSARQQAAAADSLYRELAAEFPGSAFLAERLMRGGTSVASLADTPAGNWSLEAALAPFGHDLAEIDAVRAMALTGAAADSIQSDVYVLQERVSSVMRDRSGSCLRRRIVQQVLSKDGAEAARTYTIMFTPDAGLPQLRVARVITPGGKVIEVDRGDIQIRAPQYGDSDVTDAREMVVPFSGLEPGAIVDLAYDVYDQDYLAGGWTHLEIFRGGWPTKEIIYELLTPIELKLNVVTANGVEALPARSDARIRAWRVLDPPDETDDEAWQPDRRDTSPWLGLTTYSDWQDLGGRYATAFWEVVKPDEAVRAKAAELCRGLRSPAQKAAALYRFVAEDIDPLLVELGVGRIIPSPPGEVLARGWGDCKDTSGLLIALLDAVGIEALPVLVSTSGHGTPRADLPQVFAFNHVIVQVTGLPGRPYCDPLNGPDCLGPVPSMSTGRPGLHVRRGGEVEFRVVPESTPEEHGYEMTIDVTPVGGRSLRYDIACRYRGEPAIFMHSQVATKDTTQIRRNLDESVGYGVAQGVPLRSWSHIEHECGELEVRATYVDTTWAGDSDMSAQFRLPSEGPSYWGLPRSENRRQDVRFRSPYTARTIVRLHSSETWQPSGRLAEYAAGDSLSSGRTSVQHLKEEGRPLIVLTQEFRLAVRDIPRDRYEAFRRQVNAHFMFANRVYGYHRVLDEKLLEKARAYTAEFPDDYGFRVTSAASLLGTNLGGADEEGRRRRALAREILMPALGKDVPPEVTMLAAGAACGNGNYARGDSILSAAIAKGSNSLQLLALRVAIGHELRDLDREIADLQALTSQLGNAEVIGALYGRLFMAGRHEEADRQLRRLEMMGSPMDSLTLYLTRYQAWERLERGEDMAQVLARLRPLVNDDIYARLEVGVQLVTEDYAGAIPMLEQKLAEEPTNYFWCNNLAWCLGMLGRDLERAEMLAQAAAAMADDPYSCLNTLAVVYAQRGKWKEARDLFRDLYERDDRPDHRVVNGYFLGLANLVLGDRDAGLGLWSAIDGLPGGEMWLARMREGRRLVESGGDPVAVAFAPARSAAQSGD